MLIKPGVDISRLTRPTRRALGPCDAFYFTRDFELVITSTYEGTHSPGSLHYANQAFDTRLPDPYPADFIPKLADRLGPNFDVVEEGNHIHIEYDPK